MKTRQTIQALVKPGTALALALILGACGGGDDTPTGAVDTGTEQGSEPEAGSTNDGNGESSEGDAAVLGSIPWTAPDGMSPTGLAVSPNGDHVVIGFAPPFATGAVNAEIIVFDVASGDEAWRSSIDDAGSFGLGGLMFTSAGVSFYRVGLDGAQIVTLANGSDSVTEVGFDCAQFLSGTVDPAQNVAFTVIPDGFCRVDLSTGDSTLVSAGELLEGAVGANGSIEYGDDGSLVATVMNADGVKAPLTVDPATLAFISLNAAQPPALRTLYKDQLLEGPVLSSDSRIAATPDRSTIALLQPDTIELVN